FSRTTTGVPLEVPPYAQFAQLKQVDGKARRIGVIFDPRVSGPYVEEAARAAGSLELTLVKRAVFDPREVRSALAAIADGIDALWLIPDGRLYTPEMFSFLLDSTVVQRKIGLFGFQEEH